MACGPVGSDDILYRIVGIHVFEGKVIGSQPFQLEWYDFDLSNTTDTLLIGESGLQIRVDSTEEVTYQHQSNPFLSTAMAAPSEYRPHKSSIIELISIYSPDSFFSRDRVYSPGSTLINEFSLVDYQGTALDILEVTENGKLWLEEGSSLNLMITGKINRIIQQSFTIRLTMADGSEVEATTQKILLKPN